MTPFLEKDSLIFPLSFLSLLPFELCFDQLQLLALKLAAFLVRNGLGVESFRAGFLQNGRDERLVPLVVESMPVSSDVLVDVVDFSALVNQETRLSLAFAALDHIEHGGTLS